jgi:putative holliday junction resolvase
MKYLGIDYGKTKMGLAFSEGLTASPFKVVEINGLEDALKKTQKIVEQEKIDQVVVGLPESGEARMIAEKFIKGLKPFIEVVTADETLSSHNARENMIKLGKGKKARSQEDAHSAAIILQEYLDSK